MIDLTCQQERQCSSLFLRQFLLVGIARNENVMEKKRRDLASKNNLQFLTFLQSAIIAFIAKEKTNLT